MSAPITAAMVNDLRKRTDMPMMECKAALVEVGGDMEKAIDLIRIKMKGVGVKRAGNETAEGRVSTYIDSAAKVAAVVEVRCESAPVAKSDHYVALGKEIARAVADKNPTNVEALMAAQTASGKTVADRFTETIGLLRENMKVHRFERLAGGSFGEYVHHDGSLGVIVQAEGAGDVAALRDLSMHVAAVQPTPISVQRDGVPASVIAKEKEIATAKAVATGKPPQIAERIAEGQLKTWYAENVLVEQPFVKDQAKTVGQMLKDAGFDVKKFVRFKVGEIVQ